MDLVVGNNSGEHPLQAVAIMPASPDRTEPSGDNPDDEQPAFVNGWEVVGGRHCLWCSTVFPVLLRPGRPRLYCRRSCRQRAYERRAGLGVLPPVDRRVMEPNPVVPVTMTAPVAYEAGFTPSVRRTHAMRPAARPDRHGRWPTLCGVLARPIGRPYVPQRDDACAACAMSEALRPVARPHAPSATLAALRSVLEDAGVWLDQRDRWMRGTWTGDAVPPERDTFAEIIRLRDLARRLVDAA